MSAAHRFMVETGPGAGGTFTISPEGGGIERQAGNAIVLDDPHLAPFRARLDWHQGYLYVSDPHSGAGTSVNGQPIAAATAPRPGDIVDAGASRLRFGAGTDPARQEWPASTPPSAPPLAGGWTAPGGFAPVPDCIPGRRPTAARQAPEGLGSGGTLVAAPPRCCSAAWPRWRSLSR